METVVNTRIIVRHDTAANFATNNPLLKSGEQAFETDTNKMKIGDGLNRYNSLNYIGGEASLDETNKKIYVGSTFPTGKTVIMFIKEET